jgi:hypothetical protein
VPLSDVNIGSEYNNCIAVFVFLGKFFLRFLHSFLPRPYMEWLTVTSMLFSGSNMKVQTGFQRAKAFNTKRPAEAVNNNLKVSSGDGSGGDR